MLDIVEPRLDFNQTDPFVIIMKTCPCNIQRFFQLLKLKISSEKKEDFCHVFAQNIKKFIVGTH